jgi:hypothetical protein
MPLKNKKPLKPRNKKVKVNNLNKNKNKNKIVININSNNKKATARKPPKPKSDNITPPYYSPPAPTIINMSPPSSIFDNGNYLKTQLMHDNRINTIANTQQTHNELLAGIMGRVDDRIKQGGLQIPDQRKKDIQQSAEKSLYKAFMPFSSKYGVEEDSEESTGFNGGIPSYQSDDVSSSERYRNTPEGYMTIEEYNKKYNKDGSIKKVWSRKNP